MSKHKVRRQLAKIQKRRSIERAQFVEWWTRPVSLRQPGQRVSTLAVKLGDGSEGVVLIPSGGLRDEKIRVGGELVDAPVRWVKL